MPKPYPNLSAIALTAGEPAGIGPDILIALASPPPEWQTSSETTGAFAAPLAHQLVYVGSPQLLIARANHLGRPLMLTPFKSPQLTTAGAQDSVYESDKSVQLPDKTSVPQLFYYPVACDSDIYPGQLTTKTSQYVLNTLEAAVLLCKSGAARAIVTGPVHKGIINDAGIAFSGHTDWLKERTGADHVVMLLANDHLRVALTTTHIPLSDVSNALTAARLERTIRILHREMQQLYQLAQPRIAVCGLNPHAGEGGHLGTEEQTVIEPCLEKLRSEGFKLIGPLPADTAFLPHLRAQYDVCLTHYHDQGLPVLKALDFEGAINVSLGLPIIRTSVDHGTALALAGSGKASAESFKQAVKSAIFFAQSRQQQQPPAHNASTSATQDPKDL